MNNPGNLHADVGGGRASTLPSRYYFDAAQYDLELERVWYRNWLHVGRADALAGPRSFMTYAIGTQNILLVRDEDGSIRAFHNTCRHRGSVLCTEDHGVLPSRRIVCPYHRWGYSLHGDLVNVPFLGAPEKVCGEPLALYSIQVREWGGSLFINLAEEPARAFESIIDPHIDTLKNWPLTALKVGHTHRAVLKCNWKIFWENFLECYHCPGIHPELCEMVPVYRRGVSTAGEAHSIAAYSGSHDPKASDGIRASAETWSMDGKIHGLRFTGLTAEEVAIGYSFVMAWPTMYVVAHPDYVRIVSFRPLGPETLEVKAEWLFPPETLGDPAFDIGNVTDFATMVLEQDGRVSELNQAGLRAIRHRHGLLVPQEQDISRFHDWVLQELGQGR